MRGAIRTRQAQRSLRVNRASHLTNGIVFLNSGVDRINAVNGEVGVLGATLPTLSASPLGVGYKFSAGKISFATQGPASTSDMTMLAACIWDGTDAWNSALSINADLELFIPSPASKGTRIGVDTIAASSLYSPFVPASNTILIVAVRWTASNGYIEFALNGVLDVGAFSGGHTWSAGAIAIGGGQPGDNFHGQIACTAIWAKRLADPEIAAVTRNPWQLFSKGI